jgi:hypothetical protein
VVPGAYYDIPPYAVIRDPDLQNSILVQWIRTEMSLYFRTLFNGRIATVLTCGFRQTLNS